MCFVALEDDPIEGSEIQISLTVANQATLELTGIVLRSDFDEQGNGGVLVELSASSAAEVSELDDRLPARDQRHSATTTLGIDDHPLSMALGDTLETRSPVRTEVADPDDPNEPVLEPGVTIEGRYLIESHLATGGMGEVYRAKHVHLNRPVAVKLLRRALASDPDMWARFQREAQLVSQLESPHVVRTFDFGRTAEGQAFLAMELVEGRTLDAELEAGPLTPERAIEVLKQVCEGLAEAHALGVIHRDLKPPNLIIGRRRDGTDIVKILDFGIARLADKSEKPGKKKLTQMGFIVGTPSYIAPEQALGDEVDGRTDIYALGCVAYELLTGQPPFVADELPKIISMQLTATPDPLEARRPELAAYPALCAAVLRALSKERAKRFDSVRDFAAALTGPAPIALKSPLVSTPGGLRLPSITAPATPTGQPVQLTQPLAPAASTPSPQLPLSAFVNATVASRFEANRAAALATKARKGAFVFLELQGIGIETPQGRACFGRALEVCALRDGFLDARDGGGVLVGFVAREGVPVGRATTAMLAARDAVTDEATTQSVTAQLRAMLVGSEVRPSGQVLSVAAVDRCRVFKARLQPGQLGVEKELQSETVHVAELAAAPFGAFVNGWLAPRPPPPPVGRGPLFDAADRRLAALTEPSVGIVMRGPEGCGRSTIAQEIAELARKRGHYVATVSTFASWRKIPGAGIAAIACAVAGVPFEHRATRLRGALDDLKLPAPFVEALLLAGQIIQTPWPFTPGQSAHALRVLFRSQAADRAVVLLVDGLDQLDEPSLETVIELAKRPLARELTLSLASTQLPSTRLEGLMVAEIPELSPVDVERMVGLTFGAKPGPKLTGLLAKEARGLPGAIHDWLQLLSARGGLATTNGVIELVDDAPRVSNSVLGARLELLHPNAQRVLEAVWCQGESFDLPLIASTTPRVNNATMQLITQTRWVKEGPIKRWAFASSRVRAVIGAAVSKDRPSMTQRLAAAISMQARSDPGTVELTELTRAWLAVGDGARAVQTATQAVDAALSRRAPRDAALALRLLSDAMGLTNAPVAKRVDVLARAVSCCLNASDPAGARALMDEALAVAQPTQLETAELLFALCRMSRHEGKRDHARDVLERAEFLGGGTALEALLYAERGEMAEQNGDAAKAHEAISAGLAAAEAGKELSRLHGEVELGARLEGRLGAMAITAKDARSARHHFDASAHRWRSVQAWQAQARAISNLASACALDNDFGNASKWFGMAAESGTKSGDFLFQARALVGQAKVMKKLSVPAQELKAVASEAWKIASAVGWAQGRADAEAIVKG